ncbi:Defective in cullin neddylation protein [Zea mays]|uniref:Defective in cullin neddylation protein n=1 Tax=Zea mays TaxID=4577 RepID=A0A1D6QEN9_MAIZE|nr:Defective in cullin neddylation protein [Zea mays]
MHKLGRGSRDKVQQFMAITGASEKAALQALKASDWHLEGAFDVFYSQPQIAVANTRHLEELYNRYKGGIFYSLLRQSSFYALSLIFFSNFTCAIMLCLDCSEPDADMIMVEGISQICNDLQVDPQDIVMLVISWHMKASTMCEFTRQEFIGGLQSIGVDSIEKLQAKLPSLRAELKDDPCSAKGCTSNGWFHLPVTYMFTSCREVP